MTLNAYSPDRYNGDGSTTLFSVTFPFWDADDLQVILADSDGEETTWVRGTQYTVTGGSGSTGTITVNTSPTDYTPASGETLVIRSNLPDIQDTDLPLGGPFLSTAVEQRLDKNVRLIQQMAEDVDRSLKFTITEDPSLNRDIPTVANRANKVLAFDENGNATVSDSTLDDIEGTVSAIGDTGLLVSDKTYTGDGTTATFSIGISVPNKNAVLATIDGIVQNSDHFSISGTNVVFDTAPPNGTTINLRNFGKAKNIETAEASAVSYSAPAPAGPATMTVAGIIDWVRHLSLKTVAALAGANMPSTVDWVRLQGHTTAGDGGGADYKRASSEPSHPGKIQSADEAWWEIVPDLVGLNAKAYGAGILSGDDGARINDALDTLADIGGGILRFTAADYNCSTGIGPILTSGIYLEGVGSGYPGGTNMTRPTRIQRTGAGIAPIIDWGDNGTTIVRSGGVKGIYLEGGGNAAVGIRLRGLCTHMRFEDVLVNACDNSFFAGESCFSNTWEKCIASNFSTFGWDLQELCHDAVLDNCHSVSNNSATATATVRIGVTQHCSNVNIINGCSFDHWGVTRQIHAYAVRGLSIKDSYFEAKDSSCLFIMDIGAAGDPVEGYVIEGNYIIGNGVGPDAIRLFNHDGGIIGGNYFSNFTNSRCIVRSNSGRVTVFSNDWGGMTSMSNYGGVLFLAADEIGFFGVTPTGQGAALTAADASAVNSGDATTDTVINNMRTRINELESRIQNTGLIA